MASAAAAPRHETVAALTRQSARRAARRGGSILRGGVTWIVVLAALLGGVVALNVAVLELNVRMDQLARERVELRAENASIASRLSSDARTPRIQALARSRLGLEPAPPEATIYVDLGGP
jgi:Tfp pilus assembly protein PilN